MTQATLITSLADSSGKTAITIALARLARERGHSVGYIKPKGTRLQSAVGKTLDEDPMLARELLDLDVEMHDLEPIVYTPTFLEEAIRGREDPDELRDRVREAFDTCSDGRDLTYVEGGGRLSVGAAVDLADPDVAELLDAQVILVAEFEQPGDVDDVVAATDVLGERCAGVLFNAVDDASFDRVGTDVVPFLEGRGTTVFGVIPRVDDLASVSVATVADELGATVLVEEGMDRAVERFVVGAMGPEEALRRFRRTRRAAVITGGDRAEIQTAAIEAPGVRCLVLTGGQRPSRAILGEAANAGVAVVLVNSDTVTTIDRAEDVVRSGRTRDEYTVDTMEQLLTDYTDVEALLDT